MRLGPWMRLMQGRWGEVAPQRMVLALTVSLAATVNSALGLVQDLALGRKIAATGLAAPPVFVIGHWRSGTTLLHELLSLDERFSSPATYQCFVPSHFLVSAWLKAAVAPLIPSKRPMDDMAFGVDHPQEDEFALLHLGLLSPYADLAFPNRPPRHPDALTLDGLGTDERAAWQQGLIGFLKALTLADPRRLVLKSPPHTARIRTLLEILPDAKFVFIAREPCAVYGSTLKLRRALSEVFGLQIPDHAGLEERVLADFETLIGAYEADRGLLGAGQLVEIRYEDLLADPEAAMERLYDALSLGGYDSARAAIARYFADRRDFRADSYRLPAAAEEQIALRWRPLMSRFGY